MITAHQAQNFPLFSVRPFRPSDQDLNVRHVTESKEKLATPLRVFAIDLFYF
jgi:hypothetical protein